MKRWWLVLLLVLVVGVGVWLFLGREGEMLNPLSVLRREEKREGLLIVGFLPTWMVGKTRDYKGELDELIFLGVEVAPEGRLVWDGQSRKMGNESYLELKRQVAFGGGKNVVGIKLFDDEKLGSFLASKLARERLVGELRVLVRSRGFDGVNVDFEYQADPTKILDANFFEFLDELLVADLGEVSVDVFANTIIKGSSSEVLMLVDKVDRLIIMAYDFHYPGVDYAGPVAPIRAGVGERSIWEVVERLVSLGIDKKKVVLAYPFYGYEWKTEGEEYGAKVKRGWWALASFKRVKEMVKGREVEVGWDELSMSPWLVYEEEGEKRQIYYEDMRSLRLKMDLAEKAGVAGVGFWALGYEGEGGELWKMIESYN